MNIRALIADLEECIDDIESTCSYYRLNADTMGSAISSIRYYISQIREAAPKCEICGECHDLWREGTIHYEQETDARWIAEARVSAPGQVLTAHAYGATMDEARERVICLAIRAIK